MNLSASIALSHLMSRRRQTIVSVLGVSLGVAFFLAISGLMRGSEQDFMQRLVDNSPHITVYDEYRYPKKQPIELVYPKAVYTLHGVKPKTEIKGIRQYKEKLLQLGKIKDLEIAPVLQGQVIVSYSGITRGVTLSGVVPDLMKNVSAIAHYFIQGSLESLSINPNGIIIGAGLAEKLQITIGDQLTITSPTGSVRLMKVVALFRTGTANNDDRQIYALLNRVQNFLEKPNVANLLIIKIKDPNQATTVAHQIEQDIGYKTQSWQEASEDLMNMVLIRNLIMYSVVSAILVVASFGIYNVISTVVLEKTKDIAILKSIGFGANDIEGIFLIEGSILGLLGSVLGTALGLSLMYGLSRISFKSPFYTAQAFIPIYWGMDQLLFAIAFAMLSSLCAAWLPARKGGRVKPVDILRGAE
ncbi:ABC transporter permease [Tolumonas lignilytica]|uniref:ABC transporter permease n=1 Tax=Tolumonas lignilytica TaxID=1283284 RepID=UPI00046463EC|nr:ABC transporter permease [Tolumonas lignilytica]